MASQRAKSKRHRMKKFLQDIVQPGGDRNANTVSTSQSPDPSNSPSTGAQSIASASPAAPSSGSKAASKLKKSGESAWAVLETTLRAFEKSANVFPPLRAALGGVITCLDIVQAAAVNRKDYEELATEFQMVAETLRQCVGEFGSETPSPSIESMLLSIHTQILRIKQKETRDQAGRLIESAEEKEDIIKCYRKIEMLFRQLQNDISLRTWKSVDKQRVETLLQTMSPANDARYNSSYSMTIKRRACTKETREKIQADLQGWACDPNAAKIYWMNGMAGTGKTTIAYSLCEWLEKKKQLGSSFFCSRVSASCRDINKIVPTIAYHLARYSASYRSSLCSLLDSDPDASKLNVVQQLERLIIEPLHKVQDAIPEDIVVVIDALDECENIYGVRLVLQMLLRSAGKLPLKFFVTSRPEPMITESMQSRDGYLPSVIHLHDIEQSVVEEDIKKYLTEALSLMCPPPSGDDILRLAKNSGKLFIYAATVARYICPEDTLVDSSDPLQSMLHINAKSVGDDGPSKKYDELNQLYATILTAALIKNLERKESQTRRLVLWTVVCLKEPLNVPALATLVDLTERQVALAVQSLRAVLHLSDETYLVSTLHASFPDFMLDQRRSGEFCCDIANRNQQLASSCFKVMKQQLIFNICNLNSSSVFDDDVPGLAKRVEESISPVLSYACVNWGEHLYLASFTVDLYTDSVDFLSERLLFWMEVLNLRQRGGTGGQTLLKAQDWSKKHAATSNTQQLFIEAQQFVTRFFSNTCSRSTPHIYVSMLPFYPKTSTVYTTYWQRTQGLMDVKGVSTADTVARGSIAIWNIDSSNTSIALSPDGTRIVSTYNQAKRDFGPPKYALGVWDTHTGKLIVGPLEEHTDSVVCAAFSPDGTSIASGSRDHSILVWDSYTGSIIAGPFEGHKSGVTSITFSPDGTHIIASDSWESEIRVWDVRTGIVVTRLFISDTLGATSVSFSPDGTTIASGSWDHTIRLWDIHTGNDIAEVFRGHTDRVNSISFSSDGTRLVSGSGHDPNQYKFLEPRPKPEPIDYTIRVWDVRTRKTIAGPFENPGSPVCSVVFSPDDTRIVFGSGSHGEIRDFVDCTIRVLDAHTGNLVAGPFQGHKMPVISVAISPDGARIFSSSQDCTIRVWDATTRNDMAKSFTGHTSTISSVAFSPDGSRIVSGSWDKTVRVWDAGSAKAVAGPFEGHTDCVSSVAFSPNGTTVASGSWDSNIRLWDTCMGEIDVGPLEGHTKGVISVAFSPDGATIVSGSWDYTIRLWDSQTGKLVTGPLKGHTHNVNSVAFSPDGASIVSGSRDGTIRVWDTLTGNIVSGPFEEHASFVYSVALSPDGTRIASSFSPDGTCIASSSGNKPGDPARGDAGNCIRVRDARTGETVAGPFIGYKNTIESVTFSPDGTCIVLGSGELNLLAKKDEGYSVRVLDACTGRTIAGPFNGHTGEVTSVAISSNGTSIASGSSSSGVDSGYIRLIAYHQQRELHPIFQGSWSFEPDGWITNGGVPVFWVSPYLHSYIQRPEETLVIGSHGPMQVDYKNLAIGERWSECYISG